MAKDWTRTKAYRKLAENLSDNLEARGLVEPVYREMLERYLDLWCECQALGADIRERGVSVMDFKRGMPVENRSVVIRLQVSREMRAIYSDLGFRDISARVQGAVLDDDDEL